MYKKTYYELTMSYVYLHTCLAILQTMNWVQGISKFGAKWHGTFEATALVRSYSYDNFQQVSCRALQLRIMYM